MDVNITIAVLSVVLSILFGTFSIIVTIIAAVWKVSQRFAGLDSRLAGMEQVMLAHNHRLEMMEREREKEKGK